MKILDSSALIAFLLDEQGADQVKAALPDAAMSLVNITESIGVLHRKGMTIEAAEAAVIAINLPSFAPSDSSALVAGRLSVHRPLSLGDRYCLAEAMAQSASVVTSDRVWAQLNLPVQVELIR